MNRSATVVLLVLLLGTSLVVAQSLPKDPASGDKTGSSALQNTASAQVIVKFKTMGRHALKAGADQLLARKQSFASSTDDGSDSLDKVMRHYRIERAKPVFPGYQRPTTELTKDVIKQRILKAQTKFAKRQRRAARREDPDAAADRLNNVYTFDVPSGTTAQEMCQKFQADPHVEYCQPNFKVEVLAVPNDPYFNSTGSWGQTYDDLWALKKNEMAQAWDLVEGQGMVVAVVDTGLDYNHPDIAANVWTNPGETPNNGIDDDSNGFIDDTRGWNFISNNKDPMDRYGHGTHVSGTIAASANNGIGVVGMAPKAKIMPLKGLDDTGSGTFLGLANAIVYAAENGADVINNSWGCSTACPSSPVIEDAVRIAVGMGSIVVFSAGNSATDVINTSPQNMLDSKPIVVAASTQIDTPAYFSSFGIFVDVAAPGSGLTSSDPTSIRNILSLKSAICSTALCPANLTVGGNYVRQAGTSMSAPHVSGLMALLIERHPDFTIASQKKIMEGNTTVVNVGIGTAQPAYGFGVMNANRALTDQQPYILARILAPRNGQSFIQGQALTLTGTAAAKLLDRYEIAAGQGSNPISWQTTGVSLTGGEVIDGVLGTWIPPSGGEWTLRLIVYDLLGGIQTRTVLVTVAGGNHAPQLNVIANQTVNEGQLLSLVVSATDVDGNALTYSATGLPAGAVFNSATRTFTWTPSYTQAGAYTVTFTVSDGQLTDSKTVPITVNNVVRADLIISALSSTAVTTSPGSVIAVLATVTNQGTLVAVSSRINFHLSVDAVYGGSNDVVISTNPSVASLNGGASRQITSSVTVPSSTGAGSYYLCGLSDSTARVTEENETNNALCAAVTIQVVLPDLVINAVSGPSSGARGQGIALQSTVANQGTGVAAISFNVGIYLSTDATITTADRRLSSTSVSSMLAGTTRAISTSAVVSTAVIPGTYYIGAIADYSLRAPENNETNNSRAGNVIVIQ